MTLTSEQIQELLSIINTNQSILVGNQLGMDFLSEYDKSLLVNAGIDLDTLYDSSVDSIYQSFHFGMLAEALNNAQAINKLSYTQVKDYIKQGRYIPLTFIERETIQHIKNQTLSDVRSLNGRIFQDINGILTNEGRKKQVAFIKKEIEQGIVDQKTLRQVSNEIHKKTGDWSRDFDRIVEYQMNSAYQQGRAAMIQKNSGDEDPEVYKKVFTSACKHCVNLYLTAGPGSEPRIFKLSEIIGNGSNIGRKVPDWKATIDSTHPFCRCLLFNRRKGFDWNGETQEFDILNEKTKPQLKTPRLPIRIKIAGKEVSV